MFEIFEFSQNYKDWVKLVACIVWITCLVIFGISVVPESPKPEVFVSSVSETNQPNCLVGAYVMLAKETLDEELLIGKLQKQYPLLASENMSFGAVRPIWDDMFPTHKLKCVFDCTKQDSFTNKPTFGKPYLWIGLWDINPTNQMNHACLVYFHPDCVTFKHFTYNPKTGYNYFVKTNYQFFVDRTAFLFRVK